jgi:glycine oxidase
MPIIGYVDDHERVVAATGHSGLGITLAPVTAEFVSSLLSRSADAAMLELLHVCRPDREFVPIPAPTPAPTAP